MDQVLGPDYHCRKASSKCAEDAIIILSMAWDLDIHPYSESGFGPSVGKPRNIDPGPLLVVFQHIGDGDFLAVESHYLFLPQRLFLQIVRDMDVSGMPVNPRTEQDVHGGSDDDPGRVVRRPEIISDALAGVPDPADFAVLDVISLPSA